MTLLAALAAACSGGSGETTTEATTATTTEGATTGTGSTGPTTTTTTTTAATETETTAGTTAGDDSTAQVVHSFGDYDLDGLEEVQPCVQWSLQNEKPIYINTVTLVNDGAFHHSNWFVVPDDVFEGPDGYYNCADRDFSELAAAVAGTVLFAQSTQSKFEQQELPPGVVIKVPPFHKVVSSTHMLNLSSAPFTTELRMTLDIIHPRDVDVVVSPFRMTYSDLDIPANSEARFTGHCDFAADFEGVADKPIDLKLYHVLPHYHYLGNHFSLKVLGGPDDGLDVFSLDGFNGDGNGQTFDPPIDLGGANGLSFTCGYNNWLNKDIGWGIGDQEMCVMLGLADTEVLMDLTVGSGSEIVGVEDGIIMHEGPCGVLAFPRPAHQGPPGQDEINGPLYVPPSNDPGLPPVDPCVDSDPMAAPAGDPTLTTVRDTILTPSCTFSSCHGGAGSVHGLDLAAADLHAELMGHTPAAAVDIPLVDPGNPEGSWLYQLVSQCEPRDKNDAIKAHMPLNAPTLMDDAAVATIRAWIQDGAQDN